MKIIYLTSRFPYPLEKGDKLRAYHQIRALSMSHAVTLICITDDDPNKESLEKIKSITDALYVIRITPMERFFSLISAVSTGLPFQIAWFTSTSIKNIIQKLSLEIQPDHIFCQLTRMAEYVKDLKYPKTLDYMDCFGIGMRRRANVAKGLTSLLYKIEATRMIKYEADISEKFNHLTIISEQDKSQFTFPKASEICVISNGIDKSFLEYAEHSNKEYELVFVGNMSYLPNIEAVEYIVHQILPTIHLPIKLLIAGAAPTKSIRALQNEHISVSGWIDDIKIAYTSGKIFVAPMWSGTGQQNKILEAMALGIPCITTEAVNHAIGATLNKEILIAQDAGDFVTKIQTLLSDRDLYDKISCNSKIFVKENFDWKQKGQNLSSIFALN
ncbi:MAG: glycosyltransferase [Saprospiraceae bacterium]